MALGTTFFGISWIPDSFASYAEILTSLIVFTASASGAESSGGISLDYSMRHERVLVYPERLCAITQFLIKIIPIH